MLIVCLTTNILKPFYNKVQRRPRLFIIKCRDESCIPSLHWLPIRFRISFEILLLTFKVIHGLALEYIASLICLKERPTCSLRSNSGG